MFDIERLQRGARNYPGSTRRYAPYPMGRCPASAAVGIGFAIGIAGICDKLARVSRAPVRNAHSVPTSVGVSRELRYSSRAGAFRPGKLLPKQLATGDLPTNLPSL